MNQSYYEKDDTIAEVTDENGIRRKVVNKDNLDAQLTLENIIENLKNKLNKKNKQKSKNEAIINTLSIAIILLGSLGLLTLITIPFGLASLNLAGLAYYTISLGMFGLLLVVGILDFKAFKNKKNIKDYKSLLKQYNRDLAAVREKGKLKSVTKEPIEPKYSYHFNNDILKKSSKQYIDYTAKETFVRERKKS